MQVTFGKSIRLKLAVFVGVIMVVLAASLSWVSYIFAHRTLSQQIDDRLSVIAFDRRQMLLDYVHRQQDRVVLVASRTRLRQLLAGLNHGTLPLPAVRAEASHILADAQGTAADFLEVWVTDPTGRVVAATNPQRLDADWRGHREFTAGQQGPVLGPTTHVEGRYEAIAAAPANLDDKLAGVVMVRLDVTPLLRTLSNAFGVGATGEVLVGAREGDRVRFLLPDRHGRRIEDLPLNRVPAMASAVAGGAGFFRGKDYRGVEVLAAYLPVPYQRWGIVAKMDAAEAYAPIAWLRRTFIVVELAALLVALGAAYGLARRFTQPISRMAKMTEAIAAGGLDARVVVETNDELGALARAFNQMTEEVAHAQAALEDRVRARTAELQQTNEALQVEIAERQRAEEKLAQQQVLLRSLMDNIPDLIYFKDTDSRFIRVNKAMAGRAGVADSAALEGKTDFHIFSSEHAQQAFDDEKEVMRTGQPVVGKEERETWMDGRVTWASTTKMPLRDKDGNIIGTFGISRDVTARKTAEQRLEKYAHALTRRTIQTQEDLVLAREIQMAFMPERYPTFPHGVPAAASALHFEHRYQPASTLGGDFFDVLALSDTAAGVLICDVMGHGMRSALVTAILRGLVNEHRAFADEPGEFLTQINEALLTTLQSCGSPIFATAFYLVLDSASGRLKYANAGHPSPVCLHRDRGLVEILRESAQRDGAALGLFGDTRYTTRTTTLAAGDAVLLFTDGLYEVAGPDGEPFGHDRLLTAVRSRLGLPSTQLLSELVDVGRQFAQSGEFSDDVCLVSVELARVTAPTTHETLARSPV